MNDPIENLVESARYAMATYTPMGPMTEQENADWEAHLRRMKRRKEALEVLGLTEADIALLDDARIFGVAYDEII